MATSIVGDDSLNSGQSDGRHESKKVDLQEINLCLVRPSDWPQLSEFTRLTNQYPLT